MNKKRKERFELGNTMLNLILTYDFNSFQRQNMHEDEFLFQFS